MNHKSLLTTLIKYQLPHIISIITQREREREREREMLSFIKFFKLEWVLFCI